jgi:hypothetical protein
MPTFVPYFAIQYRPVYQLDLTKKITLCMISCACVVLAKQVGVVRGCGE